MAVLWHAIAPSLCSTDLAKEIIGAVELASGIIEDSNMKSIANSTSCNDVLVGATPTTITRQTSEEDCIMCLMVLPPCRCKKPTDCFLVKQSCRQCAHYVCTTDQETTASIVSLGEMGMMLVDESLPTHMVNDPLFQIPNFNYSLKWDQA